DPEVGDDDPGRAGGEDSVAIAVATAEDEADPVGIGQSGAAAGGIGPGAGRLDRGPVAVQRSDHDMLARTDRLGGEGGVPAIAFIAAAGGPIVAAALEEEGDEAVALRVGRGRDPDSASGFDPIAHDDPF